MIDGIYKVTFVGPETGSGVIVIRNVHFNGGDGYFYYSGVFSESIGEVTASFKIKRHTPGSASVFGRDSLTVTLKGFAGKKDFTFEAPNKTFSLSGKWLEPVNFGPSVPAKCAS